MPGSNGKSSYYDLFGAEQQSAPVKLAPRQSTPSGWNLPKPADYQPTGATKTKQDFWDASRKYDQNTQQPVLRTNMLKTHGLDFNDTKAVQQWLTDNGFDTKGVDGMYGANTKKAIDTMLSSDNFTLTSAEKDMFRNFQNNSTFVGAKQRPAVTAPTPTPSWLPEWQKNPVTPEEKAEAEKRMAEKKAQQQKERNDKVTRIFNNPIMSALTAFGNAQIAGESGAGTAMAIANGYEVNPETQRWEQTAERFNDPAVAALRNNLGELGKGVLMGTAGALMAPAAGAANAAGEITGVEVAPEIIQGVEIVPEVVQAGVPALRTAGTAALQTTRAAVPAVQRALPATQRALPGAARHSWINALAEDAVIMKNGGRVNYFQQGGAAPQKGNMQEQVIALVQAAMQGDQKATQTVNQIMEAAKAGDQQALQIAQMIQQVVNQMKGQQAPASKFGSKLQYIKSLKYAKGGKTCPACQSMAKGAEVEMKKCGGKKAKKRYFGGYL